MIQPDDGESKEQFKQRLMQQMVKNGFIKKKTISEKYSVAFLATHPQTKPILEKHISPLVGDIESLRFINSTFDALCMENMGGGIPYEVMTKLLEELNALSDLAENKQT